MESSGKQLWELKMIKAEKGDGLEICRKRMKCKSRGGESLHSRVLTYSVKNTWWAKDGAQKDCGNLYLG